MAFDYSVKFNAIDKISGVVDRMNKKMSQASSVARRVSSSVQNSFNRLNLTSNFKIKTQQALQSIKKVQGKIKDIAKKPIDISLSFGSLVATGATLGVPIQRAILFEKAFAGVKKVVNGTDAEIAKLQKDIVDMTRVIPKSASEIAQMVEAGAKMGFSIEKLAQFATITAKASVAFDMTAQEAGDAFGKISSVLGFSIPMLEEFGDKINHLSDSTASSAKNMIDIVKRTAGITSTLKFDTSTIVGLASFADQMSVSSEIGATAMNQILEGMRKTEFGAEMLRKRGGFALVDLAEKFKTLEGTARTKALKDMFGAGEGARLFEKLINRTDQLKKTLDLAFSKNTLGSMTREFENVSNTTANKMILMQNSADRLAIGLGDVLLPSVNEIIQVVAPLIDKITAWAGRNKELILTISKIVAVAGLLTAGFLLVQLTLTPLLLLLKAYVFVTKAITVATWLFNSALLANPIGLMVIGVSALVVGIGYLTGGVEGAKQAFLNLISPITFVMGLLDDFLSRFEIFKKAKESIKGFFGFGDSEIKKETQIDNTTKNYTVVDVNVKAFGNVATEQKTKSTGLVKLNTASNNGV